MKDTDTNYVTDRTAMKAIGGDMWITGEYYWLASRLVFSSSSSSCDFLVRIEADSGGLNNYYALCYVYSSGDSGGYSREYGLRPCISLKSDIKVTGGDGKEGTPYELGI